ncbi:MAG: hypothetical protein ACAF41_05375 [Leptolyngbya sp. BL-A-14]
MEEVHQRQQTTKTGIGRKTKMLLLIMLIAAGFAYFARPNNQRSVIKNPKDQAEQLTPVDLPQSGLLSKPSGQILNKDVGKLRIFLRAPLPSEKSSLPPTCSGDQKAWSPRNEKHYMVKLRDWQSNKVVTTAFIRSGEKVELIIPFGAYKLRYAAGNLWYGKSHLFGSKVKYEMTERSSSGQAAKFEFQRHKPGGDLGFYCSDGNLGSKAVTDDSP